VDGLSFVAALVRSLAWPAAVVVAVVVLRRPLVRWLAVPPRRVKVGPGGVEAEWSEQTARVVESLTPKRGGTEAPETSDFAREMLALVDTASPIAGVEASYQQVGRALADIIEEARPGAAAGLNVAQLVRAAHARGLIDTANLNAVEGLGVMHTMAVLDGNGERLEPARAREFVALAEAVLYALRTQARPDDKPATLGRAPGKSVALGSELLGP
jgi:hypothetical protein